jgi:hypothetical protein
VDIPGLVPGLPALAPSAIPGEAVLPAPAAPGQGSSGGSDAAAEDAVAEKETDEGSVRKGRAVFDRAGASSIGEALPQPGMWQRFKTYLWPDIIPAWPGKTGDIVRLNGTSYPLERRIGESHVSTVWSVAGDPRVVVKLVHPDFRGDSHYGQEVEALQALSRTGISHAKLFAASPDGLVMVKEFTKGETLHRVVEQRDMIASHLSGLALLAGQLIAIGYTADLAPSNLVLDRWFSRWTLVDAGGFKSGGPLEVLGQLWKDEYFGSEWVAQNAAKRRFLTNLRVRLGPESAQWREIVRNADRLPSLKKALEELARFDAERSPPKVVFASEPEDPVLSDRLLPYGKVTASLGYDPLYVENRRRLHLDDQGKLNTVIEKISPPGRPDMVVKTADLDIIRRELAVRRIVRRWFARYFATPRSLGWGDSMVMEFMDGSPAYGRTMLDSESRVAFAILAHSFGLSDVNGGNVFYRDRDRAVLIDFEQSLGAVHPHFGRLAIDSIISEMPWMARSKVNRLQDYLPAVAEWRRIFAKPETQKALEAILLESGFTKAEVPGLLAVFRRNVDLLELSILADVEYANDYAESYVRGK